MWSGRFFFEVGRPTKIHKKNYALIVVEDVGVPVVLVFLAVT